MKLISNARLTMQNSPLMCCVLNKIWFILRSDCWTSLFIFPSGTERCRHFVCLSSPVRCTAFFLRIWREIYWLRAEDQQVLSNTCLWLLHPPPPALLFYSLKIQFYTAMNLVKLLKGFKKRQWPSKWNFSRASKIFFNWNYHFIETNIHWLDAFRFHHIQQLQYALQIV